MMLHLLLFLGFASGWTWASTGVNNASKLLTDIRLPSTVEPLYYQLQLLPVLEEGNFSLTGSVNLEILCKESTRKIVLHAKELTLDESTIQLSPFNETMLTKRGASPKVISTPPAPVNTAIPAEKDAKSIGNNKFRTPRPDFRPRITPKSWKVTRVEYDGDRDFVILHLDNALLPGDKYLLHYEYSGKLNDFLYGFYYSTYNEKSTNSKKLMAVTQMEPVDARRAFPCFDEPAMKAVFEVTLGRKEGMTALSNMPLVSTEPIENSPGWYWDHFEPSVPMSTYLVAFMISEFAYKSNVNEVVQEQTTEPEDVTNIVETNAAEPGKTVVRIWARPDAIDQADVALNVTPAILSFFEDYFQAPFPLPKIDLVAVPDFSAGAMENWGLITYRETALLLDPSAAVKMSLLYVQRVIAHELAHQWFGNLVTMGWWTDLWLNEGFATFVEGLGVHHIAPEWDYPSMRVLRIQDVMADDALKSSHPINIEVAHPNQIEEIFDSISYIKGGAMLRMMNYFLSEATFKQGVANYIQSKKYRNAQQDDLWTALTNQAHEDGSLPENVDVKTIMDTWTLQMGFPVITVTRNYEDGSVTFEQKRFLRLTTPVETAAVNQTVNQTTTEDLPAKKTALPLRQSFTRPKKPTNPPGKLRGGSGAGNSKTPPPPTYKWWVPISITNQNLSDFEDDNTRPVLWLTPSKTKDSLNYESAEDEWILVNVRMSGYYRVNYDERNWAMLTEQLVTEHNVIHPVNRAQLMDDAFALAATGVLPYDTALGMTKYLSHETHHIPWTTAARELGFIADMLLHTQKYGEFRAYMKSLVTPAYNAVGFVGRKDEAVLDTLTRSILVRLACTYGVKDCIQKSKELYAKWVESPDSRIDPDLRSMVYCFAIKYGGVDEWDLGLQRMLNASVAHERDLLISALGCTREPWLLVKYLALSLDPESGFRRQDGRRIIAAVASNPIGRAIAFRFMRDRWADITKHHGGLTTPLKMMLGVTKTMNSRTELEEVKAFLASKSAELATAESSVKKVITGVDANVHWMDLHQEPVVQALRKYTLVPN